MKTVYHAYSFETSNPVEKERYLALKASLEARGSKCFESHGGESHCNQRLHERALDLETESLFDNQWNTGPVPSLSDQGYRVFDWAQDYQPNRSKTLKRGHYLDLTDEMKAVRRNTVGCGYCGKQRPLLGAPAFCDQCIDSEYLKPGELRLLRLKPVDAKRDREPLSDAEEAILRPAYKKAQLEGSTVRGKARIAKARQDIEDEFQKSQAKAVEKQQAALWILDRFPGLLSNWIFYSHTGKHSFGWGNGLSQEVADELLSQIGSFPYDCEVILADGKKLNPGTSKVN